MYEGGRVVKGCISSTCISLERHPILTCRQGGWGSQSGKGGLGLLGDLNAAVIWGHLADNEEAVEEGSQCGPRQALP